MELSTHAHMYTHALEYQTTLEILLSIKGKNVILSVLMTEKII